MRMERRKEKKTQHDDIDAVNRIEKNILCDCANRHWQTEQAHWKLSLWHGWCVCFLRIRLCVCASVCGKLNIYTKHTWYRYSYLWRTCRAYESGNGIGGCGRDTAAVRIAPPSMLHFIHPNTHSQLVYRIWRRVAKCVRNWKERKMYPSTQSPPSPPHSAPLDECQAFVYDGIVSVLVYGCLIRLLVSLHTHAHTQRDCIQKSFLTKSRICFLRSLSLSLALWTILLHTKLNFLLSVSGTHSLSQPYLLVFFCSPVRCCFVFARTFSSVSLPSIPFSLSCMYGVFITKPKSSGIYIPPRRRERERERERGEREKSETSHTYIDGEKWNEHETNEKETEENSRECVERERPQYNYVCVVLLYTKFYLSQLIGTSS